MFGQTVCLAHTKQIDPPNEHRYPAQVPVCRGKRTSTGNSVKLFKERIIPEGAATYHSFGRTDMAPRLPSKLSKRGDTSEVADADIGDCVRVGAGHR